jgi:polyisoprenoid-binding protein YceI
MSPLLGSAVTTVVLALFAIASTTAAHETLAVSLTSVLSVEGDSAAHGYRLETHDVHVDVAFDPGAGDAPVEELVRSEAVRALRVAIPVRGLRSEETALDDDAYRALHADAHPEIVFTMHAYTVHPPDLDGTLSVEATGMLAINGIARERVLHFTSTPATDGVRVRGTTAISMSDFGLEPLRAVDTVEVTWNLMLRRPRMRD